MPPHEPLKILCFGASLIRGHTDGGLTSTPSAIWMKQTLDEKWPGKKIECRVDGVSGSMVTEHFKGRMRDVCKFIRFVGFEEV
jgi:hypothetical protein